MSQAYGRIAVHFLGSPAGFRQAVVIIDEDAWKGIKQTGSEFGSV